MHTRLQLLNTVFIVMKQQNKKQHSRERAKFPAGFKSFVEGLCQAFNWGLEIDVS